MAQETLITDADKLALYDNLVSSLAAEREAHALALRELEELRRWKHLQQAARLRLNGDLRVACERAERAERDLAEARQILAKVRLFCDDELPAPYAFALDALLPPEEPQ